MFAGSGRARPHASASCVCLVEMVRHAPDGRMSLYDLVAEWTHAKPSNAYTMLQRLMRKGIVHCNYDRVTLGGGMPTPIVTDQEWISIRSHLPSQTYMASRRKADDLYVMQYSTRDDIVKIGRSRNIEQRRRHLQDGHIFVTLVAAFPSFGCLERLVHKQLAMFRSTAGAGREWFEVTRDQAIKTIQFVIAQTDRAALARV